MLRINKVIARGPFALRLSSTKASAVGTKEVIKDVEDTSIAGLKFSSVFEGFKNNFVNSMKTSDKDKPVQLGRFKVGVDNFAKGMNFALLISLAIL